MRSVTLRYNLPEEARDFLDAYNGHKWRDVVENLLEALRRRLKYEDHPQNVDIMVDAIREELAGMISDENLQVWD